MIKYLISDKLKMADFLPESTDYVWGDWEIDEKGVVVFDWDAEGGYRCPICHQNFQTRRKETFQKHFNPKRKAPPNREEHRRSKAGIPKVKENCQYCGKSGDPNQGKKQKHLAVCQDFLKLDVNQNKTVDEEEDADNSGIDEEVEGGSEEEEAIELEDEEYEEMVKEKPNVNEQALENSESIQVEDVVEKDAITGSQEFPKLDVIEKMAVESDEYDSSLGDDSFEKVAPEGAGLEISENEQKGNKVRECTALDLDAFKNEIVLLKNKLEVASNKQKQDEKTIQDLTQIFNSRVGVQDEQIEEMEESVACLEEISCKKLKALEEKLGNAQESFEKRCEAKDVERNHLEVKLLELEGNLKKKDEANLKMKREIKEELMKRSQEKVDLEKEILELSNTVNKEKEEETVKISILEKRIQELLKEKASQESITEENKTIIEKLQKENKETTSQNSKFKDEIESVNMKNERLKQKLQKMIQKGEAEEREPMIRSVKLDSGGTPVPIGEGEYATVTKVWAHGKYMAIKEAKIELESISEALIMSKLKHPNVVSAVGVSIQGKNLLISMDCYDEDLSKYLEKIEKNQDTHIETRLKIFKDCARGLRYLHKQKIIHRDIKPQNILIQHRGDSLSASLTDFGHSNLGLSGSGWCGTRGFIAPEMYTDGTVPVYDEKVDSWSLGASMYELLVGDSLVKTEEYEEESNPTPRWGDVKINIPSFLKAVKGLLLLDPKERKSAKEVLKIL